MLLGWLKAGKVVEAMYGERYVLREHYRRAIHARKAPPPKTLNQTSGDVNDAKASRVTHPKARA
jgi:hypothetical protein